MSKNRCPECGSIRVMEAPIGGVRICLACESLLNTINGKSKQTVFHRITASPEVLAKFLVFHNRIYRGRTKYHSAVAGGEFDSYEEAIAATVAKLKEVAE